MLGIVKDCPEAGILLTGNMLRTRVALESAPNRQNRLDVVARHRATARTGGPEAALEDKAPDAPCLKQSSGLALGLTDLRRTKGLRGIAKAEAKMRVIYIAGASHTGSTLLAMMLNAHPEIIAVGELFKLNMKLTAKNAESGAQAPCSCGASSLWQCEFWSQVNQHIQSKANKSLNDLDVQAYTDFNENSAPNAAVFRAISEVSEKKFVVDSSKDLARMSYLLKMWDSNCHPIVIIRDPKGQISSVKNKYGGFFAHILRYERVYEQLRRRLGSSPHSVVRYEDLVAAPERTLRSILQPIGLDFDPLQLNWGEIPNHFVGGNRLRRLRPSNSELILDERWKHNLTRTQVNVIDLLTIGSRRFRKGPHRN